MTQPNHPESGILEAKETAPTSHSDPALQIKTRVMLSGVAQAFRQWRRTGPLLLGLMT